MTSTPTPEDVGGGSRAVGGPLRPAKTPQGRVLARRNRKLGPFTYDGVATVTMGLLAIVVSLLIWWGSTSSKPSITTPSATINQSSAIDVTANPQPKTVEPNKGPCVDSSGKNMPCGQGQAGYLVADASCVTNEALTGMSIDTELRQLDVAAARTTDGRCRLVPGHVAASAGATAEDIRRLVGGATVAVLSLCLATPTGPEIACSQGHTHEYVGPWVSSDAQPDAQKTCDTQARRYTNRSFDAASEELRISWLLAAGKYRCVVGTNLMPLLQKTVWQIGGDQLR